VCCTASAVEIRTSPDGHTYFPLSPSYENTKRVKAPDERMDKGQYSRLRAMGCDYGQGYFIAHAMPEEALLQWYGSQRLARDGRQLATAGA